MSFKDMTTGRLMNDVVFSYTNGAALSGSGFKACIFCVVEQLTKSEKTAKYPNKISGFCIINSMGYGFFTKFTLEFLRTLLIFVHLCETVANLINPFLISISAVTFSMKLSLIAATY